MNKVWWSLPGPAAFLDVLDEDVRDCRSVVLGLPDHGPAGLRDAVADRVRNGDALSWRQLDCAEASPGRLPVEFIRERLAAGDECNDPPSARMLARSRRLRGSVVWVDGASDLNWSAWTDFLVEYEAASRAYGEGEAACFIVPASGVPAPCLPREQIALASRRWSGIVSLMDMTIYAHHLLRERQVAPLYRRVTAQVIAELSGSDQSLANNLAAVTPDSLLEPMAVLEEFGRHRGWCNPLPTGDLWSSGMEDTLDGRAFLHSAAAAVCGHTEEVQRRVWRAQVGILFPFIEEHRARLVRALDRELRVPVETPFGTISDKRDLEIGQILHQIVRARVPTETLAFVRKLASMRHALAHLEVVGVDVLYTPEIRKHAQLG